MTRDGRVGENFGLLKSTSTPGGGGTLLWMMAQCRRVSSRTSCPNWKILSSTYPEILIRDIGLSITHNRTRVTLRGSSRGRWSAILARRWRQIKRSADTVTLRAATRSSGRPPYRNRMKNAPRKFVKISPKSLLERIFTSSRTTITPNS